MKAPFPSPVETWRTDTYPAISPTQAALSAKGKTVVITGAGGVIGHETAVSFAQAGASHIALVGRTEKSLDETKDAVAKTGTGNTSPHISVHHGDVKSVADMKTVAGAVGQWDVLVLAAGYMPTPGYLADADGEDYWESFEVNTKSIIVTSQAFLPHANDKGAAMIGVFPGASVFGARATAGLSGYLVSKMAQAKLLEYVAAENAHIFTVSAHPGMVDSPLLRRSGASPETLPMDNARLSADFMVWLASGQAQDLRGKTVWANWDVEELRAVASKHKGDLDMTIGTQGWPFTSTT